MPNDGREGKKSHLLFLQLLWKSTMPLPYAYKLSKKKRSNFQKKILKRSNIITVDNLYEYGNVMTTHRGINCSC